MLKKFWRLLVGWRENRALLAFRFGGYLHDIGWFRSFIEKAPVDESGNPLPWVTYPFIAFIKDRLRSDMELFEFGSGNSTFFYAARVRRVSTVEHDETWYRRIQRSLPPNVSICHVPLSSPHAYASAAVDSGRRYDIIIVDGRYRVQCVRRSLSALKKDGVIVLDDSERVEYRKARAFLAKRRFSSIDFWGIAPGISYLKGTTIFYKPGRNCLGI